MTQNDGGPAFPQFDVAVGERDGHGDALEAYTTATGGMSLRDWFAGQPNIEGSMVIICREVAEEMCGPAPEFGLGLFKWEMRVVAAARYIAADAMIAARSAQ